MKINEITKAEEQIMQIVWKLENCFVNDIIAEMPDPKPAYTTVSTIVRILEKKGFVDHKSFGNTYRYFPLISKDDYSKEFLNGFIGKYFSNSFSNLVSFFSKSEEIDVKEMEKIMELLKNEIKTKKRG